METSKRDRKLTCCQLDKTLFMFCTLIDVPTFNWSLIWQLISLDSLRTGFANGTERYARRTVNVLEV